MNTTKFKKGMKLYFRDDNTGSLRRLDKVSMILYIAVIRYFTEGKGAAKYDEVNKGVTDWKKLKPIDFVMPEEIASQLKVLTNRKEITIYYNASWRPLLTIKRPSTETEMKEITSVKDIKVDYEEVTGHTPEQLEEVVKRRTKKTKK